MKSHTFISGHHISLNKATDILMALEFNGIDFHGPRFNLPLKDHSMVTYYESSKMKTLIKFLVGDEINLNLIRMSHEGVNFSMA